MARGWGKSEEDVEAEKEQARQAAKTRPAGAADVAEMTRRHSIELSGAHRGPARENRDPGRRPRRKRPRRVATEARRKAAVQGSRLKAKWLAWSATIAVAVLCLIPIPQGAEGAAPPESDKLAHVLLFGGLALLWWRVLPRRWLLVSAGVTLYGGLMELLQALTPYRSCDLMDFLADGLGVALALVLAMLATWRPRPRFWRRRPLGRQLN